MAFRGTRVRLWLYEQDRGYLDLSTVTRQPPVVVVRDGQGQGHRQGQGRSPGTRPLRGLRATVS
jgi:hypothetical protein